MKGWKPVSDRRRLSMSNFLLTEVDIFNILLIEIKESKEAKSEEQDYSLESEYLTFFCSFFAILFSK